MVAATGVARAPTSEAVKVVRHGGVSDPLTRMYGRVVSMGKGGADSDMYRGVVGAGPLEGQVHALKYRKPDDPGSLRIARLHDDPRR